ncbi:MAG: diguanylate cyclase domain-containing protein [Desulfosalsimonas sp.]
MKYQKFLYFLQNAGRDPSALVFEDELTGLYNRRYLLQYFKNCVTWDALEENPLCLLMIDADYLKKINDQYGQNAGDQALVLISDAIRKAAPENSVAVRYAGDNFLLLLPGCTRQGARQAAEKILHLTRKSGLNMEGTGARIPLTVSIGIAAAPEDAPDGKALVHRADTAMYLAKHSGRDRLAEAEEQGLTELLPETLLRHLDSAGIVGRRRQLAAVGRALKKVTEGSSRFLIAEGAPGMGKTSFVEAIEKNLKKTRLRAVRVNGALQEAFRPYYLASYAAMGLMNQIPDKGLKTLESLGEEEIRRLSHVIPQLKGGSLPLPENDPWEREAIFTAFTRFLTRLSGKRPLVLLVDDFHYCDPASLHLLRMLMKEEGLLIFICATASVEKNLSGQSVALDLFRNAHSEELGIETVTLPPLGKTDIEQYLNTIFGGVMLPENLCSQMAAATQGNPLFLVEIIRKMIGDGRIYYEGGKWNITAPENEYFPKSLDEIVRGKIKHLDEESRRFIDRASAYGESGFLSTLAAISRDRGTRIYDIINNAERQGIVRTDFEENDENIRFSSKQVRDIIYDGISLEEKKLLHQQIGVHQEKLYKQDLLPSAAFLAHHFSRATDEEKARFYKEYQETLNSQIFQENETELYTGDDTESPENREARDDGAAEGLGDRRLSRESMKHVPHLLRALLVAVRNTRLYPRESKSVTSAVREVAKLLERIFRNDPGVSVTVDQDRIWINGEELTDPGLRWITGRIVDLWGRLEIRSLVFKKNVDETQILAIFEELARPGGNTITPGYWESFVRNGQLTGITVRQVRYKKKPSSRQVQPPESGSAAGEGLQAAGPAPDDSAAVNRDNLHGAKKVISSLLGTYGQLRLYPPGGPVAKKAVSRLAETLQDFLSEDRALTVARVEGSLLVNGIKVDSAGYEALFAAMVKLLEGAGLNSLTFTNKVSESDLEAFFEALFITPSRNLDSGFWGRFAQSRQLSGIFFDLRVYDIRRLQPLAQDREPPENGDDKKQEAPGPENHEASLSGDQDMASLLRDLFLGGETEKVSSILAGMSEKYKVSNPAAKNALLEKFSDISDPPDWQPAAAYVKMVADLLVMPVFESETEPEKLQKAADILHDAAVKLILYGEYPPAARIFTRIGRHRQFTEAARLETWDRAHAFGRRLDPRIAETLASDLKSTDQARRQQACQLISTIGRGMAPMLIELIKNEEDIRIRRIAAELLGRADTRTVEQVRQSMISESRADKKSRILEIMDSVTTDLATELRYTLTDPQQQVRRAAFRLAGRLETRETDELLSELARSRDTDLAVEAINTIGRRNSRGTHGVLIKILSEEKNPDVLTEVCRAMGRIGSSDFVQPLANIIMSRRRWLKRRKYPPGVRISAVYAVCRIPGEHIEIMIPALKQDPDPGVREAASVIGSRIGSSFK